MALPLLSDAGGGDDDVFHAIAATLAARGWCETPHFLDAPTVEALALEVEAARAAGRFRAAGVGRGRRWELRPEVRTDQVLWLGDRQPGAAQQAYLRDLERLRLAINEVTRLGLFEFEGHFAVYPPGSYYRKHHDQFRDVGTREVSCVLYLNPHWDAAWGGALRLFLGEGGAEPHVDIVPSGGKLVTFLTREFYHEVCTTHRDRYSLTGWFRRRD